MRIKIRLLKKNVRVGIRKTMKKIKEKSKAYFKP